MKELCTVHGKIIVGDCIEVMKTLPEQSVHMVCTSPPYWGLRDYQTEGQIGLEETPQQYVEKMVKVFREVRRILRDDGCVFLNLGDSYGAGGGGQINFSSSTLTGGKGARDNSNTNHKQRTGIGSKQLVGIPWRVAFALQEDGWILRQDIIWSKPNAMPESVTDRCGKAHEYIFLLTKKPKYFFDHVAIQEHANCGIFNGFSKQSKGADNSRNDGGRSSIVLEKDTRNKRSVWTVPVAMEKEKHFACYPQKLITPCILAGTSQKGVCNQCGAPWKRKLEKVGGGTKVKKESKRDRSFASSRNGLLGVSTLDDPIKTKTVGWFSSCRCNNSEPIPSTVFDPFSGLATTGQAAIKRGRRYMGIELNEEYAKISLKKLRKAEAQRGFGF